MSDHGPAPALRIVRGDPSPEEVAALVAVLAAASAGAQVAEAAPEASQWAPPARLMRQPLAPSGWWAASLPR